MPHNELIRTRPNRREALPVVLALGMLWTAVGKLSLAEGSEPPRPSSSLEAFPILAMRNLFDPARTRFQQSPSEPREEPRSERPRTDFITLTGTMTHGTNAYAFFGGSQSEYNQIIKPQDHIANFTVAQITTSYVLLQLETNDLILPVGHQLRREGDAPWHLSGRATAESASVASPDARPPGASPAIPSGPAPPPTEETNDLLKRMMERREKEISQ